MKKPLILIPLILILLASIAYATRPLIIEYDESNYTTEIRITRHSSQAQGSGTTIFFAENQTVEVVSFYMKLNSVSFYGDMQARIQLAGSDHLPDVPIIVNSTYVNANTLTADFQWINFTFETPTELAHDTIYAIFIYAMNTAGTQWDTTAANTNCTYMGYDATGTFLSGQKIRVINGGWSTQSGEDMCFRLYGEDVPDPTPTPTPTPSPTPSPSPTPTPAPTVYTGSLSYIIAFIVCIIPAIIGYLTVGPWGFLVGLNVGVALGITSFGNYVPVWAGLLMAVMDVAALLTSGLGGKDGLK